MSVMIFLGDPVWWVSVVVAGILINFFCAYSKAWLDRGLSHISGKWRRSSENRKSKNQNRLERLAKSEYERIKTIAGVTHSLVLAVSFEIMALTGMYLAVTNSKSMPKWASLGVAAITILCLAMAMAAMVGAMAAKKNVEAAEKLNGPE
ncbi:hypothetical protein [Pseudomonas farsensis]|uniref:DUF2721 domain-containing protein n=1 Tax=Pseudomonas farsensis TaxID=2745492 RepID=A0ABU8QN17_9PSED